MAGEDDLDKLFELVADGEAVDWDALERAAPDEETRALLRQLRLIAEVSEVHRSQVDDIPTPEAVTVPVALPGRGGSLPPHLPRLATEPAPDQGGAWGPLLLVRKIGEGSYGEVYHAHDTWLDHPVALKLLKREAESRVQPSDLLHEARKLARVRHTNVVTVHGADRHNGRVGFWMDFIDGETLAARVAKGRLSAGEATSVGQEVCQALAAVHRANIIHRDVKAQNVMRAHDGGRIILMDFGAGQFVDDPSFGKRAQGTPLYLAPEVLRGDDATVRSDIYAVGILLYHLVTSRFPVEGRSPRELSEAHERGMRRRLRDERPDLPESFIAIVERAIDPDPARRYASAGEMEAKLSGEPSTRPEPIPPRFRREAADSVARWTWQLWVPLAAGGLLVGLTLAGAITSIFYYAALSLWGPFQSESYLEWPLWGLRAVLAPLVYVGGAIAIWLVVLTLIYRQVVLKIGRLRSIVAPILSWTNRLAVSARESPTATTASLIFVAQCGLLVVTAWWFRDLLNGFDDLILHEAGDLSPLSTANGDQQRYFRQVLSFDFLVATAAWWALIRRNSETHERGAWLSICGGVAATFITVMLLVMPYRILSHNEHERVVHRSETCYLVGQRVNEGLLFCPLQDPPRNRVVRLDDPELQRGGPEESVFAQLGKPVNAVEVK
jgi:hypothetical protein